MRTIRRLQQERMKSSAPTPTSVVTGNQNIETDNEMPAPPRPAEVRKGRKRTDSESSVQTSVSCSSERPYKARKTEDSFPQKVEAALSSIKASLRRLDERMKTNEERMTRIEQEFARLTANHWRTAVKCACGSGTLGQMCDELQGRLHTKSPWSLFRYLMAPDDTKLEKRKLLTKLVRELDGEDIYARLRSLYLESPQPATPLPTAYGGTENGRLDAPIIESEVRHAMAGVKTTSAPGADKVTNRMLRNLDDESFLRITEYFNEMWTNGRLPESFRHATTYQQEMEFYLKTQGIDIPRTNNVRVLGMIISMKNGQSSIVKYIRKHADNLARLVRRLSRKSYGLKENRTCRLVHAFVLSRIMYTAPYMNLNEGTIKTLDTIISKAFKTALGLPTCTPNDALEQLGLHNTFEEMRLAQRTAQEQRLSKSATGLITLQRTGVKQSKKEQHGTGLKSYPAAKNMNSARDKGRREARARALDTLHNGQEHVYHADAGTYPSEENNCVVAVYNANCTTTASVRASNVNEAEEAEIALALNLAAAKGHPANITSDSRSAIMKLSNGKAGPAARNLLLKTAPKEEASYSLTWVPGHSGHSGNEGTHSLVVRAQNIRTNGGMGIPSTNGDYNYGASPLTRGPIRRKILGEPYKKLTLLPESTWRRLQLRNSLTPRTRRRSWPDLFKGNCEECGFADGSWRHTYWECPEDPLPTVLRDILEEDDSTVWERILVAEDYTIQ
ncbi:hypothetical protein HPB47_024861, partial [Ixodes persulcatus]